MSETTYRTVDDLLSGVAERCQRLADALDLGAVCIRRGNASDKAGEGEWRAWVGDSEFPEATGCSRLQIQALQGLLDWLTDEATRRRNALDAALVGSDV